ncbi:hypothetical protein LUZ60_009300 [Juncus effusus]|nr:hypothetical protein LUZ60_009300 [Juncus effusus]
MADVRRKCTFAMAVTKLERLPPGLEAAAELRWKRKHRGRRLFPFLSGEKREIVAVSRIKRAERDGSLEWEVEEEACRIENGSVSVAAEFGDSGSASSSSDSDCDSTDHALVSILCGDQVRGKNKENKLEIIGTANINLAELIRVSKSTNKLNKKLFHEGETKRVPITLRIGYVTYDALLYVKIKLVESYKGSKIIPSLSDSSTELIDSAKKSDKVTFFGVRKRSLTNNINDRDESEKFHFSIPKQNFFSWRRQRKESDLKELEKNPKNNWEKKEFICREVQTKLKTFVFFASIDQRERTAGGESACTALVAFLANYLIHKKDLNCLKKDEIDRLIRDGSSEWRKLCEDESLIKRFPNKHFDLETIIKANIRPITVINEKSFVGFFQPENFKSLRGAKSFDEIWSEITKNIQHDEIRVYIISWNDHFFVLKLEHNAFYIVDTLGERLYEGCKNAYVLKFDDYSEMYKLRSKKEELIFRGKECCKEFIKRFLAAIPLREELEIENKAGGIMELAAPHLRLQIEFHFVGLKFEENLKRQCELVEVVLDRT